jgi:hypothetical protein
LLPAHLEHTVCSRSAPTIVLIPGGTRGEIAMEEFLAMLAVQLFVLIAERVVTYLSQNWTPAAT